MQRQGTCIIYTEDRRTDIHRGKVSYTQRTDEQINREARYMYHIHRGQTGQIYIEARYHIQRGQTDRYT